MDLKSMFSKFSDGEIICALNQNPEPAVKYIRVDVDAGTTSPNTPRRITTELGGGEVLRIYSIHAHVLPQGYTITTNNTINSGANTAAGTQVWLSGYDNLTISLRVGANLVPNNAFDLAIINNSDSKCLMLPTPITIKWSDDFTVSITNNDPTVPNDAPGTGVNDPGTVSSVKLYFVGEAINEAELRERLLRDKIEEAMEEAAMVKEYSKGQG